MPFFEYQLEVKIKKLLEKIKKLEDRIRALEQDRDRALAGYPGYE